jgi:hypothetical protein
MFPVLVALVVSMTACTHWSGDLERIVDETGRDFKTDPDRDYKHVDLGDVVAHPTAFKLMDISFEGILNRVPEEIYLAYYTTFRQEDFVSFSAWSGEAPLWEISARIHSVPTLFMRKDNPYIHRVLDANRFALFEIKGRVMGDYEQIPWIEVLDVVEVSPAVYTEQSLKDYKAGMDALHQNRPAEAILKLESAVKAPLASKIRLQVRLALGKLYEARGDYEHAAVHYDAILIEDETNDAAWEGWERCQKALETKRAAEGTPVKPKK